MSSLRLRDVYCARRWAVESWLRHQGLVEVAINQKPATHSIQE